uniref:Uncharacterized protein n=1 Tax=Oryza brachyantha TaxID=4533 RepID=J3LPP9_ORYBR
MDRIVTDVGEATSSYTGNLHAQRGEGKRVTNKARIHRYEGEEDLFIKLKLRYWKN